MTDLLEEIPLIHGKACEVYEVLLYQTQQESTEESRIVIHYSNSPLSYYYLLRVTVCFFFSWPGTLLPSSYISASASFIVLIISNILLFQCEMSQSTTSRYFAYFGTNKKLHNILNFFIFQHAVFKMLVTILRKAVVEITCTKTTAIHL